jgi:alpha-tubulin suppressor-like RCC1 family protein
VALRADGTLWAWGRNNNGQLGLGTFTSVALGTNTPQRVGTNSDWQAIAAGTFHTVALRADGTLWAWGANVAGQLGIGTFTTDAPGGISTPQRVGTDADWQVITAGAGHTVALRADGTLWAWGNNYGGALGIGTFTTNAPYGISTPQQVGTDTNWGPPP